MLDPVRLRLLAELARHGSMTAVAEAVAYTSSAVSQQLAVLQRETGTVLYERVGRGVRLTPEGRLLARRAEAVLAALDAAEAELKGAADGDPRGTVRVAGYATGVAGHLLPAVAEARRRHPGLRVVVRELDPEEALRALRSADCDLALVFRYGLLPERPADGEGLPHRPLGTERVLVALPDDHPAAVRAGGGAVDLRSLAEEEWVVGSRSDSDREMVSRACAVVGFAPRLGHEVDDYGLALRLVRERLGVALVPEAAVTGGPPPGIAALPTGIPALVRHSAAATRTSGQSSPAVRALLDLLAPRRPRAPKGRAGSA